MKRTKFEIGWVVLTVLGVVAFGMHLVKGDVKGEFQLETAEGDSRVLAAFPLEGYGGNDDDSFRFSMVDGKIEAKYSSCSAEKMWKILQAEALGKTGFSKYLYEPEPGGDVYAVPIIIAAEGANTVQEDTLDESLEAIQKRDYAEGITIRTDKVKIFCETEIERSSQRVGIGTWNVKLDMARFDTGLSLADQEYLFVTGTEENGYYDYDNYFTNYEKKQRAYRVKIGDEAYVVVAPDEKCEGQTYVFKVSAFPDDQLLAAKDNFWDTVHYSDAVGKAEPIIPIPAFAEGRVIGLDKIEEKGLLLLHTIRGENAYTDVYDTEGTLLGSAKMQLNGKAYQYAFVNTVSWEEGVSVDIRMQEDYDANGAVGRMLLWVDADNQIKQIPRDAQMDAAIVRNQMVLYLHSEEEEALPVVEILGCEMKGVDTVTVCAYETGQILYQGHFVGNEY